jgi:hypothetical protein
VSSALLRALDMEARAGCCFCVEVQCLPLSVPSGSSAKCDPHACTPATGKARLHVICLKKVIKYLAGLEEKSSYAQL